MNKEGLEKIAEKLTRFGKMFFELIRIETGKGGVGGYSTRLEPAHMIKTFDKIGGNILVLIGHI